MRSPDTPGFIVTESRVRFGEAISSSREGVADAPTIDIAMKELGGFGWGRSN
jgi:3-hydroxyacyl-CoA dehydrogenase